MRVVAGLGNPGARYAHTRHNVGFMVVREIAKRWNVSLGARESGAPALHGSATAGGQEVRLLMPQTYMNRSGAALEGLVESPAGESLIVVYDDLDLPPGGLRIRRAGGAGGHRGVESIIESCGPSFVRVRVGIGRPPQDMETAEYVLAELSSEERDELAAAVTRAADAVECVLAEGAQAAMNKFNAIQAAPASTAPQA